MEFFNWAEGGPCTLFDLSERNVFLKDTDHQYQFQFQIKSLSLIILYLNYFEMQA